MVMTRHGFSTSETATVPVAEIGVPRSLAGGGVVRLVGSLGVLLVADGGTGAPAVEGDPELEGPEPVVPHPPRARAHTAADSAAYREILTPVRRPRTTDRSRINPVRGPTSGLRRSGGIRVGCAVQGL